MVTVLYAVTMEGFRSHARVTLSCYIIWLQESQGRVKTLCQETKDFLHARRLFDAVYSSINQKPDHVKGMLFRTRILTC